MPSNKSPRTTVTSGRGKLSVGVASASALSFPVGQGGGGVGGGSSPIPQSGEISYGGGSAWADGTTNPATSVEGQFDKILTELSATAGAARIGAASTGNLADASPVTGSSVQALINGLVSRLAATAGAGRVGATSTSSTFADGSAASGATVQALVNSIVNMLGEAEGSDRIGSDDIGSGLFAISAGSVLDALTTLRTGLSAYANSRTVTGNATLNDSGLESLLYLNPSSTQTLQLPAPNTVTGFKFTLVNMSGNMGPSNSYTLVRNDSETINGAASGYVLSKPFGKWEVVSDGTNWSLTELLNNAASSWAVGPTTCTSGTTKLRITDHLLDYQTTNATQSNAYTFTIPDEAVTCVDVLVTAIESTGAAAASYKRTITFRRDNGTVSTVGSMRDNQTDETSSSWNVVLDNSGATGRVRVTGASSTTIRWGISIRIQSTVP